MAFDAELGEPRRPAEIGKIDDEGGAHHIGVDPSQELHCGLRRPAGGDQVVDEEHGVARADRVLMDLDDVD